MYTFATLFLTAFHFAQETDQRFTFSYTIGNQYSVSSSVDEDTLVTVKVVKDDTEIFRIVETEDGWYAEIFDPRTNTWVKEGAPHRSQGPVLNNDRADRIEKYRQSWNNFAPGIINALNAFIDEYNVE